MGNFSKRLFENYERYKEHSLKNSRFTHKEITELISRLGDDFHIQTAGYSHNRREIFKITFGQGKTKILLWSQMHGDEPTATMALFDIFNFLQADDEFNPYREKIRNELTVVFLPFLNPDGGEVFTRRNALGIDLNRDARTLASNEAKILDSLVRECAPRFAFNLHDQSKRYSVGKEKKPVLLAFLAPPFDYHKNLSPSRIEAMKLISFLFESVYDFADGKIARYKDDHEPRSFGDRIQGMGVSTILIESGRTPDPNRNFVRKLNFLALLLAFHAIATGDYEAQDLAVYESIPQNGEEYFDLVLRNVLCDNVLCDVGINRDEFYSDNGFFYVGKIADIGDLSFSWGIEELNAKGLTVVKGEISSETFAHGKTEEMQKALRETAQGNLFAFAEKAPEGNFTSLPINLIVGNKIPDTKVMTDNFANFVLRDEKGIKYVILNGFLSAPYEADKIKNALIYR